MRLRNTIVMLLLALLGLGYIFLVEKGPRRSSDRNVLGDRFAFEPEAVRSIEISRTDEVIACSLEGDAWQIRRPFGAKADESVVNRMLAALHNLESTAAIEREERRARGLTVADYGLVPPRVVVRIEGKGFRRLLNIGSASADGKSVYLAIDNAKENVYVANPDFLAALPKRASDLRSKQLFDYAPETVERIEIKTSEAFISIVRDDDTGWHLQQPVMARADRARVMRLIDALTDLRIATFLPDASPQAPIYGFDEVDSMVLMKGGEDVLGKELRLGLPLQDQPGMVYASFRGEDSVFALPETILDALKGLKVDSLRDRSLLSLSMDDLHAIRISDEKHVIELESVAGGWRMLKPRHWAADRARVETVLDSLVSARIADFIPAGESNQWWHAKATNSIEIALAMAGGNQGAEADPFSLKLDLQVCKDSATARNCTAVKRSDSKWIYLLAEDTLESIQVEPLHYKDHIVVSIDPTRIESIRLRKEGEEQILQRNERGEFFAPSLDGQGNPRILPQERRLETLASLSCREYVESGEFSPAEYGLDNPKRSLTLLLSGDQGISKTLLFGNTRGDGGIYAQIRGQDVVFVLDQQVAETLCDELYIVGDGAPAQ